MCSSVPGFETTCLKTQKKYSRHIPLYTAFALLWFICTSLQLQVDVGNAAAREKTALLLPEVAERACVWPWLSVATDFTDLRPPKGYVIVYSKTGGGVCISLGLEVIVGSGWYLFLAFFWLDLRTLTF